jgi:hypothetical protein
MRYSLIRRAALIASSASTCNALALWVIAKDRVTALAKLTSSQLDHHPYAVPCSRRANLARFPVHPDSSIGPAVAIV